MSGSQELAVAGPIVLRQTGSCDGESGIHTGLHVAGATGDTLLLVGSSAVSDLGGWTVSVPTDVAACNARAGDACNELLTDRPLEFRHAEDSDGDGVLETTGLQADMGEEATMGAYTLRVNLSQTGSGGYLCSDGGGTDYTNFWVIGPG